ncbi:ThuA domain-containing protein [Humibacter soli]
MPARITVISGSGRYADPWHPFAETSERIAGILEDAGHDVTISGDVDARLAELVQFAPAAQPEPEPARSTAGDREPRPDADDGDGADGVDLLVVNVGAPVIRDDSGEITGPWEDPEADAASRRGLLAYLASGRPLLAFHVSSTSFGYMPEWESILGGLWVRGTTMHPPYSRAEVEVATDAHDVVAGIHDFEVDDERYTSMRVSPGATQLAWHAHEGLRHPLLWTHEYGASRVVYDALGHDAASYDAPEHRAIVANAAAWLLR